MRDPRDPSGTARPGVRVSAPVGDDAVAAQELVPGVNGLP